MARFDKQVAVITGAASGIGKEIALRYAAEGGTPMIADLNLDAAKATAEEIKGKGKGKGGDAFAVAMKVIDEAAVTKGVDDVMAKYGRIDLLVSNAGIQIVHPIVDFPYADWKKLLSIHLDGAFLTTKACLKHMYAAKSGAIVYMGSVHSKEASRLKAPYVTATHGLIGLCKVVAKEGAEFHVRANVVCPGFVRTPLVDKQIPEQARELHISEEQGGQDDHAERHRRRRVHHHRRRCRLRVVLRQRQDQRADRAVDRGQPRLVHAVGRQQAIVYGGAIGKIAHVRTFASGS
jgi:3-hydroxybutyrate dehydrogenase